MFAILRPTACWVHKALQLSPDKEVFQRVPVGSIQAGIRIRCRLRAISQRWFIRMLVSSLEPGVSGRAIAASQLSLFLFIICMVPF